MKKILILYIVFSFILLFIENNHMIAEPPPPGCEVGFTQMSFTLQVGDNPSCQYKVWICYKCKPLIPNPNEIHYRVEYEIVRFQPTNFLCRKYQGEVLNAVENQIKDPDFIKNYLCNVGEVPNCEDTWIKFLITVRTSMCWRKYNDPDFDNVLYEKCPDDASKCYRVWKICWNQTTEDFEYSFDEGPTIENGPPNCGIEEPPDPNPGEYSDCFQVCSPCTPSLCGE